VEGSVTTDYAYDRADQLQQQTISGVSKAEDEALNEGQSEFNYNPGFAFPVINGVDPLAPGNPFTMPRMEFPLFRFPVFEFFFL